MCNSHNHPPGCQCGWGGVWYGGSSNYADWLFNKLPYQRRLGLQQATRLAISNSFTTPNASCPVCGANVYFYKSQHGGKVFFDALGPPWPKHPCTSGGQVSAIKNDIVLWHRSNWYSMSDVSINQAKAISSLYQMTGIFQFKNIQLIFKADEIVMAEMVRLRRRGHGEFDISILDYDAIKLEWIHWRGIAYADEYIANDAARDLEKTVIQTD